jgi:hypothetical protein
MTFNDLYDKLNAYSLKLMSKDDFHKFLEENLTINTYIPVIQKYALVGIVGKIYKNSVKVEENSEDFSAEYIYMRYEVIKMFNLLFKYIDMVVPVEKQTLKDYDLVMESGLYDFIESRCHNDYQYLSNMCDKISGVDNLLLVHEFIHEIGDRFSVENMKEIRKELSKLDMRKLKLLESVAQFNDPITAEVANALKEKTHEEVFEAHKEAAEEKSENTETNIEEK